MIKELNIRSFISLSWRIFATATTIIIIYIFLVGSLAIAAGAIEWFSKIILFWAHERIWIKIKWGKKQLNHLIYGSQLTIIW